MATGKFGRRAASSSCRAADEFSDFGESPVSRAATAVYQALGIFAHLAATLGVAQQFDPRYSRVLGALDLDGCVGANKTRGNIRKIFHRRPKHRNLTECRGLQNIMPTRWHQRSTNKCAVG